MVYVYGNHSNNTLQTNLFFKSKIVYFILYISELGMSGSEKKHYSLVVDKCSN